MVTQYYVLPNEKIASDLAYLLKFPVPPVTLWDRGLDPAGRFAAISAWAFPNSIEWRTFSIGFQSGSARTRIEGICRNVCI